MTTQPVAPIFGEYSLEMFPPALIKAMSVSEKSKPSSAFTFSVLSPKETS